MNLSTIWLGLNAHQLRYVVDRRGTSYSSSSLFAEPAAVEENLVQELPSAHMLSIRVLSEVVGCVFVAVIFLKIETAQSPEGVEVIPKPSFFHNPPGGLGLPGGSHRLHPGHPGAL